MSSPDDYVMVDYLLLLIIILTVFITLQNTFIGLTYRSNSNCIFFSFNSSRMTHPTRRNFYFYRWVDRARYSISVVTHRMLIPEVPCLIPGIEQSMIFSGFPRLEFHLRLPAEIS